MIKVLIPALLSLLFSGCTGVPAKVTPVDNFELNRYLGKWYEIARLDHSFERGLERVTAEYSLRDDGGVAVVNRGYSSKNNQWKEAKGKAYFVEDETTGYLKVSFFGPFYGSYIVFDIDRAGYQYSFVCGPDYSYLWLLSRTPEVPQQLIEEFKSTAEDLGFDTSELIFVEHTGDSS